MSRKLLPIRAFLVLAGLLLSSAVWAQTGKCPDGQFVNVVNNGIVSQACSSIAGAGFMTTTAGNALPEAFQKIAPHVPTTAALSATSTVTYPAGVWRDDTVAGYGDRQVFFNPSNAACALNAGAGDGGSQVPSADGKCWFGSLGSEASVKDFGAAGNDTPDDTPAINRALDWFRATVVSSTIGGSSLTFPVGTYKISTGVNATNLVAYPHSNPATINGEGATLDCRPAVAQSCFDMLGSTSVIVKGLALSGTNIGGAQPTTGIQYGRTSTASADRMVFRDVTIQGLFSVTPWYNLASESALEDHVKYYNSNVSATAYDAIYDGLNHFGLSSQYVSITLPADTAVSFQQPVILGGDYRRFAGGPSIWMGNVYSPRFYGSYVLNQATQYPVVLYTGIGNIWNPYFDLHVENATNPATFFITGAENNTPTIGGLTYLENYNFATGSVFKADTNITAVLMTDTKLHVNQFNTPSLKVVDTPSIYTITGDVQVPAAANWTTPGAFSGRLCLGSVCSVYAAKASLGGASTLVSGLNIWQTAPTTGALSQGPGLLIGDTVTSNGLPFAYSYKLGATSGANVAFGSNWYFDNTGTGAVRSNTTRNGWAFNHDARDGVTDGDFNIVEVTSGGVASTPFGFTPSGGLKMIKSTASGTAPGAGKIKFETVAGTNAGTCKLIMYAGTSATPTTVVDNAGAGC